MFKTSIFCFLLFLQPLGYALSPPRGADFELTISHGQREIGLFENQKNDLGELLANVRRQCRDISDISIKSFSSDSADRNENIEISRIRVKAVKDYLQRLEIPGVPIYTTTTGYGSDEAQTPMEIRKSRTLVLIACPTIYPTSTFTNR